MRDVIEEDIQQQKRQEAENNQLLSDVRTMMATPEGRRFIRWFFGQFPLKRELYTKNADTYYFLGQWSVTRAVDNLLSDAVPDLMCPLLLREDFDCARDYRTQGTR